MRAHTRPRGLRLVPELTVRVTDDVVALWEAIEAEHGPVGLDPPFWAAAWPGGQALARYLLDHPETVAGRTVLDLGSGSGLVALAALRAGAHRVVASDVDPFCRPAIALNAAHNGLPVPDVVGDLLDGPPPPGTDLILTGDVCYDRAMTARVLAFLRSARTDGCDVLLGDPGRAYLPAAGLALLAEYEVSDVDAPDTRRAAVWRLT